jgi:hypothetical protein
MKHFNFRRPSTNELRALLTGLSLLAISLAGSAGGHWN